MSKQGFTLIEILVVVAIFGIIVVLGSSLFFSLLRGSTKSRILKVVRQNGDYALAVMGIMVRNAASLPNYSGSSITIVNPDGGTTIFSCSSGRIASNGASLMSSEVKVNDCSSVFSLDLKEGGAAPAVMTIKFSLSQQAVAARPEEQALMNFQTTVSLRNY
jgi:prepilin-type N-terminal cleavage/methylation domain-containing protein